MHGLVWGEPELTIDRCDQYCSGSDVKIGMNVLMSSDDKSLSKTLYSYRRDMFYNKIIVQLNN